MKQKKGTYGILPFSSVPLFYDLLTLCRMIYLGVIFPNFFFQLPIRFVV